MTDRTRGVVYVAAGLSHALEAVQSARSVRKWMPTIPITLFTDVQLSMLPGAPFDELLPLADREQTYAVKIAPLLQSPYEKTLFLDTDTFMCRSCEEVFGLLERFELLVAHDPY